MNRYKLSMAGVSAKEGIQRFNGEVNEYEKCLMLFLTDNNYEMMCTMLQKGDAKGAFELAHALKGVVGNLSMKRLYEDISAIVDILRVGSLDFPEGLLKKTKIDYEAVLEAIR